MTVLMMSLVACKDLGGGGLGLPGGEDGTVYLEARHNYTFTSEISLEAYEVRERADVVFDWCDLTVDFLGLALDPLEVDMIQVTHWTLTEEELEDRLVSTAVSQEYLAGEANAEPSGVCEVLLSEMTFLGNPVTPSVDFYDDGKAWLVTLYTDGTPQIPNSPTAVPDNTLARLSSGIGSLAMRRTSRSQA